MVAVSNMNPFYSIMLKEKQRDRSIDLANLSVDQILFRF
jgi:hypothetical protein